MLLIVSHFNAFEENLPWSANVRDMFSQNGLLEDFLRRVEGLEEDNEDSLANILMERMVDQYNQTSFGKINSSNKLKVFSQLKTEHGRETYLSKVIISKHRRAMSKLRMGAHSLEIERGRYEEADRVDRLCKHCQAFGLREVEDEAHFLLKCPQYKELREDLLPQNILEDLNLNTEQKFVRIISDTDSCQSVAKFIYHAFQDREIGLEVLNTLQDVVKCAEIDSSLPTLYSIRETTKDGMKITLTKTDRYLPISSSNDGMKLTLARIK